MIRENGKEGTKIMLHRNEGRRTKIVRVSAGVSHHTIIGYTKDRQIRTRLDVLKPMLSAEVQRRSVRQKNGSIQRNATKMDGNRFISLMWGRKC